MSTPSAKINELATRSLNTSDYIIKGEGSVMYRTTLQALKEFIGVIGATAFKGSLAILDIPSEDGFYFASESGTYTNAGSLVVDLTEGLSIIVRIGGVYTKIVIPLDLSGYVPSGGYDGTVKELEDEILLFKDTYRSYILFNNQSLSVTKRVYVPVSVKSGDIVKAIVTDVSGGAVYSVSLSLTNPLTAIQSILLNQTADSDGFVVANNDYPFMYFHLSNDIGSYSVQVIVVKSSDLKSWILDDSYSLSNLIYDPKGNISQADLVFPDGETGEITGNLVDDQGRISEVYYQYGVPALISYKTVVSYSGDDISSINVVKI